MRPSWDDYFINIAMSVSKRSTCIRRMYGAVIVKDRIIVSTGYNGSPRGMDNCIDVMCCARELMNVPRGERYELCVAVHAEANAIINASLNDMKDSTIYIAGVHFNGSVAPGLPCIMCSRMINNAMIKKVVYLDQYGVKCVVPGRLPITLKEG